MFVYPSVILTLLLLFLFFYFLQRNKIYFGFYWWLQLLHFILLFGFLWVMGAWPYIGNWVRYAVLILFSGWLVRGITKRKKGTQKKIPVVWSLIYFLMIGVLFLGYREIYFSTHTDQEIIDLEFPLKNGKYVIEQGGDSKLTNLSHRYRIPDSHALDIIRLNSFGMRGKKIFSKNVHDYSIYGDTVYSPCDCKVLDTGNGIEDNIPPKMEEVHRGGNYVRLSKGDITILLAHLQINSILVKKGQHLKPGDPIGLVGNTGYSIEPHLHIQAYRKEIYGRDQIAMRFKGRLLKINDTVGK